MQSCVQNIRFILEGFFFRSPVVVVRARKYSELVCIKIVSFLCKRFPILTAILHIQNSSHLILRGTRVPQTAGNSPRYFAGPIVWGKLFRNSCYKTYLPFVPHLITCLVLLKFMYILSHDSFFCCLMPLCVLQLLSGLGLGPAVGCCKSMRILSLVILIHFN
jgi:hypothetical protein